MSPSTVDLTCVNLNIRVRRLSYLRPKIRHPEQRPTALKKIKEINLISMRVLDQKLKKKVYPSLFLGSASDSTLPATNYYHSLFFTYWPCQLWHPLLLIPSHYIIEYQNLPLHLYHMRIKYTKRLVTELNRDLLTINYELTSGRNLKLLMLVII